MKPVLTGTPSRKVFASTSRAIRRSAFCVIAVVFFISLSNFPDRSHIPHGRETAPDRCDPRQYCFGFRRLQLQIARAEAEADAVIASFAVTKAAWQNGYNAARAEALDVEVLARALNIAHKTVGQRSFTQPWTVADAEYVRRAILAGETE